MTPQETYFSKEPHRETMTLHFNQSKPVNAFLYLSSLDEKKALQPLDEIAKPEYFFIKSIALKNAN
jgi:hypothetical protein